MKQNNAGQRIYIGSMCKFPSFSFSHICGPTCVCKMKCKEKSLKRMVQCKPRCELLTRNIQNLYRFYFFRSLWIQSINNSDIRVKRKEIPEKSKVMHDPFFQWPFKKCNLPELRIHIAHFSNISISSNNVHFFFPFGFRYKRSLHARSS